MQKIISSILISALLSLTSCSYISFDKLQNATATEKKRVELLDRRVKDYHAAIYWGDVTKASNYVSPEFRRSFIKDFSARTPKERMVEIKIEGMTFEEETTKAIVNSRIRYFRVPENVVNTRLEKEYWEYERYKQGWINKGVEEVESFANPEDEYEMEDPAIPEKSFRARLNADPQEE